MEETKYIFSKDKYLKHRPNKCLGYDQWVEDLDGQEVTKNTYGFYTPTSKVYSGYLLLSEWVVEVCE